MRSHQTKVTANIAHAILHMLYRPPRSAEHCAVMLHTWRSVSPTEFTELYCHIFVVGKAVVLGALVQPDVQP